MSRGELCLFHIPVSIVLSSDGMLFLRKYSSMIKKKMGKELSGDVESSVWPPRGHRQEDQVQNEKRKG